MSTYPTWKKLSDREWVSEEQVDGVPDFQLLKQFTVSGSPLSPVTWGLKWRTSQQWVMFRGRSAVEDAKASVAKDVAARDATVAAAQKVEAQMGRRMLEMLASALLGARMAERSAAEGNLSEMISARERYSALLEYTMHVTGAGSPRIAQHVSEALKADEPRRRLFLDLLDMAKNPAVPAIPSNT